MARIAGVDVPNNKQVRIGLTYIYGIGDSRAARFSPRQTSIPSPRWARSTRMRSTASVTSSSRRARSKATSARTISLNIKRLIEIQSYRGLRHRRSLPVRGQRTHTNARTRKGPRKGTVAGKKKATK